MTSDPNGWPSVCKCGATAVSPCNRSPCFRGERDPGRVYNEAEVAARVAEARNKALEEAAAVARAIAGWKVEDAIRALKEGGDV